MANETTKLNPSVWQMVKDNIWSRHPVLVQGLALAPALVASTSAMNALALTLMLTCLTMPVAVFASLVGTKLPKWLRVPLYVLLAALAYWPVYQLILQFYPAMNTNLGVFLPLLTVSSFIYTKAEKRGLYLPPHKALLDAFLGGLSFGLLVFIVGSAREIFGAGRFMGLPVSFIKAPMNALLLPFAGFVIAAFLAAMIQYFKVKKNPDAATLWESDLLWDGAEVLDPDHAPKDVQQRLEELVAADEMAAQPSAEATIQPTAPLADDADEEVAK